MTSHDYINLSLAMYVHSKWWGCTSTKICSGQLYNVNVRQGKNNLRPCEHPACTDLEGIGVKVQCKITFSSQQQACALTVTQIHV